MLPDVASDKVYIPTRRNQVRNGPQPGVRERAAARRGNLKQGKVLF
jgi:hypothetical protein